MRLLFLLLTYIFFAAIIAIQYLDMLQPVEDLLTSSDYALQLGNSTITVFVILKSLLTIIVGLLLLRVFLSFGERRILKIKSITESSKLLLIKVFQILFYFIFAVTGLKFVGIDLTALTFLGGGIGIGLGFGLQKIAGNFISGLIILNEKSVRIGDLVELGDGTFGYIRKIATRYTMLEAFDGKDILVPNEDMVTTRVINWTFADIKRRVTIRVGVAYDSNLEKARKIILDAASNHPKCLNNPGPSCFLEEFGDSSVNYMLIFWIADVTEGFFQPRSEILLDISKQFEKHNIVIPFPQRDVRMVNPPK